jgi:hypothetical protein
MGVNLDGDGEQEGDNLPKITGGGYRISYPPNIFGVQNGDFNASSLLGLC